MSFEEIIDNLKPELEKVIADFKAELMKLRTSRLSPGLIEDIEAACFDSVLPIKQLGAISSLSQRELQVQLWDKSYTEGAVKAIEQEGLGLGIRVDGANIYLSSPSLTQENRQNLILVLNKRKEEVFQSLRHLRDKAWKQIQDGFSSGEIMEDAKYKGKEKLDKEVRGVRDKLEDMVKNKEEEIKG